ncbi:MAG: hypothetical protein AAB875_04540 [Patescibacteria group bacterium]
METEQRIDQAKEVVRQLFGRYGRPHHRIHENAAMDNVNRMRALEGLCGHCINIELRFGRRDGKEVVTLGCTKGQFPSAVYDNILFGEEAFCRHFSKNGVVK